MGTRGAICFVADGTEKVVYNHWDSYPSGLGEDVAAWLRASLDEEANLRAAVIALRPVDEDGIPTEADFEQFAEFRDERVSRGSDWYALLRHTQGSPAAILRAGVYGDAAKFPLDSLFCEWAYVVDFDARKFEVYEGFRSSPATEGRWTGKAGAEDGNGYYPVQRVKAWSFDDLPEKGQVSDLENSDDESEN